MHKPYNLARDPIFFVTVAFFALFTTSLPAALGQFRFLPIVQTISLTAFNIIALRNHAPRSAIAATGMWLLLQSLTIFLLVWLLPAAGIHSQADGFNRSSQTLEWAFAGSALPGSLAASPLARVIEVVGVVIGGLFSAGLVGVWFLMRAANLAAFNAGVLQDTIAHPVALLLVWPIWTVLRLVGYAGLLIVLSQPISTGEWSPDYYWLRHRKLILGSLICIGLGFALEVLLSGLWARLLSGLMPG